MIKSAVSELLSTRVKSALEALEFLAQETDELNDRNSISNLHNYIKRSLNSGFLTGDIDAVSIADEVSAIRSTITLSIVDEHDKEMEEKSPGLTRIKSASGLAIANLDTLLQTLAISGSRPSSVEFSSAVGYNISSTDVASSIIEISDRLDAIDEILSNEISIAARAIAATQSQKSMFTHFIEATSRKIIIAKSNLDTPNLIDVVAVLRIVEQILRSTRAFFEGASKMVESLTQSARTSARLIWDRARLLGTSAKRFAERVSEKPEDKAEKDGYLPQKYILSWDATKTILSSSSDQKTWHALLSSELNSDEIKYGGSEEIAYLLAASSLPVISGGLWPSVIRFARYRVETISAERIGIDTARRLHWANDLSISSEISNQRCLVTEALGPEGLTYDGGSWFAAHLGISVNATKEDREDEVYDVAVALDECKLSVKRLNATVLRRELETFVSLSGISAERKLMAIALLYESECVDDILLKVLPSLDPSIAPALVFTILKTVLARSATDSKKREVDFFSILENEVKSIIGYVVGLWIIDNVVTGSVQQFRRAFDQEWAKLKS